MLIATGLVTLAVPTGLLLLAEDRDDGAGPSPQSQVFAEEGEGSQVLVGLAMAGLGGLALGSLLAVAGEPGAKVRSERRPLPRRRNYDLIGTPGGAAFRAGF